MTLSEFGSVFRAYLSAEYQKASDQQIGEFASKSIPPDVVKQWLEMSPGQLRDYLKDHNFQMVQKEGQANYSVSKTKGFFNRLFGR